MCSDITTWFSITQDPVTKLLKMSLHDADDVEKIAGLESISPEQTVCDTGLQSTQDDKLHVSQGRH